jgi:hypothetical protein
MRPPAQQGPVLSTVFTLVDGLREGAGSNWIGFCPIHGEVRGKSTPSFSFNAATGQWNCFAGCGAGGLTQLLKRLHKSDQYIDRTMERLRPYLVPTSKKKNVIAAGGIFLTEYPLPEKVLGLFEYAPQELLKLGFDPQVLQDNDVGVDTQRHRTTYAIRDLHGTLAGIAGKPIDPGEGGKYRVYEQELVEMGFRGYHINNRQFFWRWEKVYPAVYNAKNPGPVYVTEGYKAALWLVQHGYYNTVAVMGTTLSLTQQMFLERLGTKIILCGDNDHWGRIGVSKIGYKLRGQDVAVMRYPYPEIKLQPDDLTQSEIDEALGTPLSLREWRRNYHEHFTSG